ncbi:MAG: hypothetical protein FWC13_09420 [Oscillospiraceae bacterium]|nr:hypothetical protein [Oscillospiraceae bacterium]
MSKVSSVRYIATLALSFCLSISLLLLISMSILLLTVFNSHYMLSRLNHSEFALHVAGELEEVYISHGHASGISPETMLSLISTEKIAIALEYSVRAAYGNVSPYNFSSHTERMFNILHEYALSLGFDDTPLLVQGLYDLATLCTAELQSRMESILINLMSEVMHFHVHAIIATAVLAFFSALSIFFIHLANSSVTRTIDGLLYSFGTVSIICAAVPIFFHITALTSRIQIMPLSLNRFITSWLDGIIHSYLFALLILLLCMFACILIRISRRNKRIKSIN